MEQVNVLTAKNRLSDMLRNLEAGTESRYIIARRGIPVAQLTLVDDMQGAEHRIGAANGLKLVADEYDFDAPDPQIEALFGVS